MQIILTEEEYNKLKNSDAVRIERERLLRVFETEFNTLLAIIVKDKSYLQDIELLSKQEVLERIRVMKTISVADLLSIKDKVFKNI